MILILFLIYQEHKQKSLYSAFASAFLLLFLCFYYICQQFNSFYNTLLIKKWLRSETSLFNVKY
jgi:hypothetical protein